MKSLKNTKILVITALMAAFTCIATMVIQIPTPTFGYIHVGDCLVLLCGIILGPVNGSLAAGIGSMFADLFTGYTIYAIPTLIIKAITAMLAAIIFRRLKAFHLNTYTAFIIAGVVAEINMMAGYFINKIIQVCFFSGSFDKVTLAAGYADAVTGILSNTIQGIAGVALGMILLPLLSKIPEVKNWMTLKHPA